MSPNVISNIVYVALAIAATVAQKWFTIPSEVITALWTLAGINGVKTSAITQYVHDTAKLQTLSQSQTTLIQEPVVQPVSVPTRAGTPGR